MSIVNGPEPKVRHGRSSRTRPGRLSAQDWITAGAQALRHGVVAVAVEPLAASLGVTRGSFYAHFDSRDELLIAVLDRWRATERAADQKLIVGDDPHQTLAQYLEWMFTDRTAGEIHAHLCASALDSIVGPVHIELSFERIAVLQRLYHAVGLDPDDARQRALVTYTAYMGFWRALTTMPQIERAREMGADISIFDGYAEHIVPLLAPPATHPERDPSHG
jgi:AcrR family transcriptional regulator